MQVDANIEDTPGTKCSLVEGPRAGDDDTIWCSDCGYLFSGEAQYWRHLTTTMHMRSFIMKSLIQQQDLCRHADEMRWRRDTTASPMEVDHADGLGSSHHE